MHELHCAGLCSLPSQAWDPSDLYYELRDILHAYPHTFFKLNHVPEGYFFIQVKDLNEGLDIIPMIRASIRFNGPNQAKLRCTWSYSSQQSFARTFIGLRLPQREDNAHWSGLDDSFPASQHEIEQLLSLNAKSYMTAIHRRFNLEDNWRVHHVHQHYPKPMNGCDNWGHRSMDNWHSTQQEQTERYERFSAKPQEDSHWKQDGTRRQEDQERYDRGFNAAMKGELTEATKAAWNQDDQHHCARGKQPDDPPYPAGDAEGTTPPHQYPSGVYQARWKRPGRFCGNHAAFSGSPAEPPPHTEDDHPRNQPKPGHILGQPAAFSGVNHDDDSTSELDTDHSSEALLTPQQRHELHMKQARDHKKAMKAANVEKHEAWLRQTQEASARRKQKNMDRHQATLMKQQQDSMERKKERLSTHLAAMDAASASRKAALLKHDYEQSLQHDREIAAQMAQQDIDDAAQAVTQATEAMDSLQVQIQTLQDELEAETDTAEGLQPIDTAGKQSPNRVKPQSPSPASPATSEEVSLQILLNQGFKPQAHIFSQLQPFPQPLQCKNCGINAPTTTPCFANLKKDHPMN